MTNPLCVKALCDGERGVPIYGTGCVHYSQQRCGNLLSVLFNPIFDNVQHTTNIVSNFFFFESQKSYAERF